MALSFNKQLPGENGIGVKFCHFWPKKNNSEGEAVFEIHKMNLRFGGHFLFYLVVKIKC